MRRLFLMALAAVLATLSLAVPTASAVESDRSPVADDTAEDSQPQVKRQKHRRAIRLRCHGQITDAGDPSISCSWSQKRHRSAADSYKLVRVGPDGRSTVFESSDLTATQFVDTNVDFDTRYKYRVLVLNDSGKRIRRSRWNRATVHAPVLEPIAMTCDLTEDDATSVTCTWDAATTDTATQYQLWRKVRGHHRELVATVGIDELAAVDSDLPSDVKKVAYVVLALDADDDLVGRSRLAKVVLAVAEA